MNNLDEPAIITSVVNGNANAFAVLVNRYQHLALTLAYNILLNRQEAEDATQDAFVKAYTSLGSFKGTARFSTWLYRIVVNTALNKKKRNRFASVEIDDEITQETVSDFNPDVYHYSDQAVYIKLAMEKLSEAERICLTMFYLNELSVEEISGLTAYTPSNIKVLLYRGRKHLLAQLHAILQQDVLDLIR